MRKYGFVALLSFANGMVRAPPFPENADVAKVRDFFGPFSAGIPRVLGNFWGAQIWGPHNDAHGLKFIIMSTYVSLNS